MWSVFGQGQETWGHKKVATIPVCSLHLIKQVNKNFIYDFEKIRKHLKSYKNKPIWFLDLFCRCAQLWRRINIGARPRDEQTDRGGWVRLPVQVNRIQHQVGVHPLLLYQSFGMEMWTEFCFTFWPSWTYLRYLPEKKYTHLDQVPSAFTTFRKYTSVIPSAIRKMKISARVRGEWLQVPCKDGKSKIQFIFLSILKTF